MSKFSERSIDIRQVSSITHRINRVNILFPYRFVALLQVSHLIVLLGNLTDAPNAQECIFMVFVAHLPKTLTIFAKVFPHSARLSFSVASFLLWSCAIRRDFDRTLDAFQYPTCSAADRARFGCGRPFKSFELPNGFCRSRTAAVATQLDFLIRKLSALIHSAV